MKKEWQKKALGELCDVIGGGTPSKEKSVFYSGHIPWATVRDMRQDPITETEFRITKDAVKSSSTNIIPSGSVVIATRVGLGKVCILGQDTAINQDLRGIIPRNEDNLEVRYLYWWFKSITDVIIAEGTGATVQGVRLPFVKSLLIPFPPLDEQKRIVAKLDKAFVGLAKAKENAVKNLQNARALFESHLQSVFTQRGPGWAVKKLESLGEIRTGKRDANHQVENGPYPFYTCAFGQFKSPTFSFNGPSIILPGNGANVGKVFFHDGKFEAYQRTYVVNELNQAINPRFLYFCFSANWPGWIATKQFGSATNYIVVGDLKAFPVPTPSLAVQQATVEQLESFTEETQRLARIYEQKLEALESLKKSILHEAFSGNL